MTTDTASLFDIVTATRAELTAYEAGRIDGYLEGEAVGYQRGWAACDLEVSALQRAAHRVVATMVRTPEARRRGAVA